MSPGMGDPGAPLDGGNGPPPRVPDAGGPPSTLGLAGTAEPRDGSTGQDRSPRAGGQRPSQGGGLAPPTPPHPRIRPFAFVPGATPVPPRPWPPRPPAPLRPDTARCISGRATGRLPPRLGDISAEGCRRAGWGGGRWRGDVAAGSPCRPRTPRPPAIAPRRLPEMGPSGRHLPRGGRGPVPAALVHPRRAVPTPVAPQGCVLAPYAPHPDPARAATEGGAVAAGGLLSAPGALCHHGPVAVMS